MTRILDISDNAAAEGFAREHGLSLLVEHRGVRILFDTGSGETFAGNAARMGVDVRSCGAVVISHGHSDHSGGLPLVPPDAAAYTGRGVEEPCFSRHPDGFLHDISMPGPAADFLKSADWRVVDGFTEICAGVFLTGRIPRESGAEAPGSFFRDAAGSEPALINDEIAMLLDNGTLITGCCHAGIADTLRCCAVNRPDIKVRTIIGGLHLMRAGAAALDATAAALEAYRPEKVVALHCTGSAAVRYLSARMGGIVATGAAGTEIFRCG